MKLKENIRFFLVPALLFILTFSAFAQSDMIILEKDEDYRGKPDGIYGRSDYRDEYIDTIYYVKNGLCQKEERFNRYGKVSREVIYKNGFPAATRSFYDMEDLFRDIRDSMDRGSLEFTGLLLICCIGLLLTKGLPGFGFWVCFYFVTCLLFVEGIGNILLKGIGQARTTTFFRCLTMVQIIFFLSAFFYLLRGMWSVFSEKKQGLFFIFTGVLFTLSADFLNLISYYHGLSYALVSHVKSFLFVFLFSMALMVKLFFIQSEKSVTRF